MDYSKLGLKCGLEIHQQLDTNKLFCNCPSMLRKDEPDFIIKRKLHAVAGESGKIDVAAAYQASLNKEFVYQGYDSTCLVELDEEPPHEINKDSLKIALQIAVLLHAKIIPIAQIMRKTVIDGSNTSGFQRTVMIARDGYVETEQGRVGIDGIYLEEDSARVVSKAPQAYPDKSSMKISTGGKVVYRLDRLGIPLVEIATSPDIKTPEQAKEVALHIGDILRSCKVKRGLGTIRQDVNLSLKGGERVEIKGMQDMKIFLKVFENEVKRQEELVPKKESKSEVRNALANGKTEFLRPMPGSARMYPETDLLLLKIHRDLINEVKRDLPKLRSEIEKELEHEGLNHEMIKLLFKENKVEEFKEMLKIIHKPQLIVKSLLIFPKEIASRHELGLDKIFEIVEDNLADVLNLVKKRKISENRVKDVLVKLVEGKDLKAAIKVEKVADNVEERIAKIIKEKPGLSDKAYMGLVMKEFKGQINGKDAMEIIGRHLK
jgi:Glu-tRNA(Gln) amidotransferase subunit E-like FAD-binding protein